MLYVLTEILKLTISQSIDLDGLLFDDDVFRLLHISLSARRPTRFTSLSNGSPADRPIRSVNALSLLTDGRSRIRCVITLWLPKRIASSERAIPSSSGGRRPSDRGHTLLCRRCVDRYWPSVSWLWRRRSDFDRSCRMTLRRLPRTSRYRLLRLGRISSVRRDVIPRL